MGWQCGDSYPATIFPECPMKLFLHSKKQVDSFSRGVAQHWSIDNLISLSD